MLKKKFSKNKNRDERTFFAICINHFCVIARRHTNFVCTHPNNNSQKFQNSNPEIKWINGELNNKLFYKIFLIILKWFYFHSLSLHSTHTQNARTRRGVKISPEFQSELIGNVDVFNIHFYDIFHMYNHWKQYPMPAWCIQNIKQKENRKNTKWKLQIFHPSVPNTQQPPLKYSVMYGYSMM